jgi:hypothetical protein
VHEKGFNFDDSRIMRGAWRNESNPEICVVKSLLELVKLIVICGLTILSCTELGTTGFPPPFKSKSFDLWI